MSGLQIDFVIYLGDPDEGAEMLSSAEALERAESLKGRLPFPDVQGAITITREGKDVVDRMPDPIFSLVTNIVRAVPYIIDGEAEGAVLAESEFGFLFEPAGDDILVSFFAGDRYEPDEFLLQQASVPLSDFGEQVLSMGERLRDLMKKIDPEVFERDDYSKSLVEFLDTGRDAFKTFQLESKHGLRMT